MQLTSTPTNTHALTLAGPAAAPAPDAAVNAPAPNVAPAPAATAHGTAHCLNCGHSVPDRFCGRCGQDAHHTHRLTMRHLLLHDLPHSIWHVDKGIAYTLRQMLTRPGDTLREYMAGRRAQHFRPVTYLLLITAIGVLLMSSIHYNPVSTNEAAEMPRLLKLTMERYLQLYYKYPTLIYVILLPVYALIASWLLRPARFNFAEILISQTFISGTTTLISTIVGLPVMLLVTRFPELKSLTFVAMLPFMIYSAWVYYQLLKPTRMPVEDKWVRSIGTVVLQTVVLLLSSFAVMIGIMFMLVRQDPSLIKELKKGKPKAPAPTSMPAPRL